MKFTKNLLILIIFIILCLDNIVFSQSFIETSAKQGVMIDFKSGQRLLSKNEHQLMKPASMGKLMTVYIVFDKITNKQLSFDDKFIVSEKAWKKRGSRSFLEPGQSISIRDLLMGVIVQSGNDAAIVLAEGISGSEDNFATYMNSLAKEIGMKNTNFTNSTGWPDDKQFTTADDLSILTQSLIKSFPNLYKLFSEKSFTINGIKQGNRNPILYNKIVFGADGLKTGHTEESGYGLVGSAKRNNLRFILVLNGMNSQKHRKEESARLLNFAFREYKEINFFQKNDTVVDAKVWLGINDRVSLKVGEDISLLLNSIEQRNVKITAYWREPIFAPIKKNMEVGELKIDLSNNKIITYPLYVSNTINKDTILNRISSKIDYFIWGTVR